MGFKNIEFNGNKTILTEDLIKIYGNPNLDLKK